MVCLACFAGLVAAPSLLSCGSSKSAQNAGVGGASAFVGTWTCTIEGAGASAAEIVVTENADGTISASLSDDAGLSCSIKYTANGTSATAESGQTCSADGQSVSVTAGSASVSGTTLDASLTITLLGFPATYSFQCMMP
ncbi:MAG: hypothetical protein ABSC94_13325 [Polyangiaceae bacterium]|jgi:hypothetical protein